jgi:3-dehydroquinate synthase
MERTVRVKLGHRSYDVHIGTNLLVRLGAFSAAGARQAVVVADSNVSELYGGRALAALKSADMIATLVDFPAGEEHKTLATYGKVMDELFAVSPPIDRDTLIVALGGGVSGDLAGFVAATALRGLRWLQCPTTLLAAVDSSVGGKTGVDHPAGKNLIGAFHQPCGVLIDVETLKTLPVEQLRSGLAECVKHGMIRDAAMLDFIDAHAAAILQADPDVLTELVVRNVAIKAAVVSADERESSIRAHLNFGHTIGHAIETHLGLGRISHGQAVALGMVAACRLAVRRGLVEKTVALRLEDLLARLDLPIAWQGLDVDAIWTIMQHDKKNRQGRVRMVLSTGEGTVGLFSDVSAEEIRNAVEYLRR